MKIHSCGTISTEMPGRDGFAFPAAVEIKTGGTEIIIGLQTAIISYVG